MGTKQDGTIPTDGGVFDDATFNNETPFFGGGDKATEQTESEGYSFLEEEEQTENSEEAEQDIEASIKEKQTESEGYDSLEEEEEAEQTENDKGVEQEIEAVEEDLELE